MKLFPLVFCLVACLTAHGISQEAVREWTSSDGKKLMGTVTKVEGDKISLQTERGLFEIPLSRLSEADQTYAAGWLEKMSTKAAADGVKRASYLGDFESLVLGEWPQYVVAELEVDQIEEVPQESGEGYTYRTPHFEFRSPEKLSVSVVREFARIFEATYAFIDQMPLGLAPSPSANGFYQTELFKSREDYYAGGGPSGSGGVFSWSRRGNEMKGLIKVPLPNLGVEYTGTRFVVDQSKRSTTLTHEITHQVMMRWLATSMPTWLSEGFAEFVSSQTYDNGRFKLSSMNRAISEEVTRGQGRDFSMLGLESLMNISHSEWASALTSGGAGLNYNSANILAYYFLRLDGNGDAAHLVEFLKVLASGDKKAIETAQADHLLRGRSYDQLEEEVAKAWRSEGLKIGFL